MVDLSEVDLSQINTDKLKLFLQFALTILENYEEKRIRLQFEEGPYKLDSLIPLYEKALNKTYDLLEKGIENLKQKGYVSHVHLHNIATTFLKLLDALKENYSHEKRVYFNSELFDLIIDDASETLNADLEHHRSSYKISPLEEFQGHCSNLQTWAENDYDTRLLHRNLAFPLLKKLSEKGDAIAKSKFKDEIAKRLELGELNVFGYLHNEGYLATFTPEELEIIVSNIKDPLTRLFVRKYELYDNNNNNNYYGDPELENELNEKHILLENRKVLVAHYNDNNNDQLKKPFKKVQYKSKINVSDKIKCRLVNSKFLDFYIPTKQHKIVFQKALIDKAREYLNNNCDITVEIPNGLSPLIFKSKKANLMVYIIPDIIN